MMRRVINPLIVSIILIDDVHGYRLPVYGSRLTMETLLEGIVNLGVSSEIVNLRCHDLMKHCTGIECDFGKSNLFAPIMWRRSSPLSRSRGDVVQEDLYESSNRIAIFETCSMTKFFSQESCGGLSLQYDFLTFKQNEMG
jgi:hypothetical protein